MSYTVLARGEGAHPAGDAEALRDYFNLGTRLAPLAAGWAAADQRFRDVQPYIPGMAPGLPGIMLSSVVRCTPAHCKDALQHSVSIAQLICVHMSGGMSSISRKHSIH